MDEKVIDLVLKKLEELGSNYGPAFTDAAVNYAHMKAFENSVVPLIVFVAACYLTKVFSKDCKPISPYGTFYEEMCAPIVTATFGLVAIVMFIAMLNPAAWYGLFEPKVYLAYRLFEKVL